MVRKDRNLIICQKYLFIYSCKFKGTNNFGGSSETEIAAGVSAIISELRSRLPNSRILLLGILPRSNAQWTEFAERINAIISGEDDGNMVRYLNMYNSFYVGDGQFYYELYDPDLVHLVAAGYGKW